MRRFSIVLLLCIIASTFSGCFHVQYDVKNTTVIQGIGIDYDKTKDKYVVSAEIFDISLASSGSEAPEGNLTKIIKDESNTVSGAVNNITLQIGKTPIYSQKRVIIIGEEALEQGLDNVIDFFLRDYKTRSSVLVAVAKDCSAAELLAANEGNASFPAREIQTVLESGNINGYTTDVDIALITELSKDTSSSVYLPLLGITEETRNEKKTDQYATLKGFKIIRKEKPVGDLTLTQGRGMLFINNDMKGGTVNLKNEQLGIVTLKIIDSSTSVSASVDMVPEFDVSVDCTIDVTEVEKHKDSTFTKTEADKLELMVEDYIRNSIRNTIKICLDDYSADVFGFGRRIWIFYPSYYKSMNKELDKLISSENVNVDVKAKIRRLGQENM